MKAHEKCVECGRKPVLPNTQAYLDAKTRLWLMTYGWSEAVAHTTRLAYCNTCGVKTDRRRKFYNES